MTDLNALIKRLEKASGPDRELDWSILKATDARIMAIYPAQEFATAKFDNGSAGTIPCPRFTSSIDAATMLVPEGWHGFVRFGKWPEHDNEFQSVMWSGDRSIPESFFGVTSKPAATPAIALTIAALSARTRTARGKSGAEDCSIQKADIDAKQSVPKQSQALEPWRVELDELVSHLGGAIMQSTDRDDRIIMDHVKAAHEIAKIIRRQA